MNAYSWPGEDGRPVPDTAAAWPETVRKLPVGTRITGEVIGRQRFGVFLAVDDCPGAMGLARVSEMPRCMELPMPGQRVTGQVAWHSDREYQVGVVLGEWAEHEDLLPRYRAGQVVEARVVQIASIGIFVHLDDCVGGLIPLTDQPASPETFHEGQELRVRIVTVDRERNRILLAGPVA
ncbi:S1 RNA-binding domain-containing protein [Streptomyces sp. NPDC091371]|uniref:S1 RNA-binding domain-containing protein n=1 Tax=Streptomyces sp. NPDC091371 TaxID=3155303 RepID=UPI00341DDD58